MTNPDDPKREELTSIQKGEVLAWVLGPILGGILIAALAILIGSR